MFKKIWNCGNNSNVQSLLLNEMFKWIIGDGENIRLWKDLCCGMHALNMKFPRMYNLDVNKNSSVNKMKQTWGKPGIICWRRRLRGWEIDEEVYLREIIDQIYLFDKKDKVI